MLWRRAEHLVDRASGPLHFRLFIMPLVVTFLAIRAGLKDVRKGQPSFLWTFLTAPSRRRELLRSAMKDIGRIFIVAVVLDTAYQLVVLRAFYLGELLIVAIACAVVPYVLIRGPVALLARALRKRRTGNADQSSARVDEAFRREG